LRKGRRKLPSPDSELNRNRQVPDSKNQKSDKELLERVKANDTYAFSLLVDRYKVKLFNLIYRMLQNREEAEDILQETFLRVFKEKARFDPTYSFSTWIYTIALNLCRRFGFDQGRSEICSGEGIQLRKFELGSGESHSFPAGEVSDGIPVERDQPALL
jgi:hypothetical protein